MTVPKCIARPPGPLRLTLTPLIGPLPIAGSGSGGSPAMQHTALANRAAITSSGAIPNCPAQ
jgi:hypothetical protein